MPVLGLRTEAEVRIGALKMRTAQVRALLASRGMADLPTPTFERVLGLVVAAELAVEEYERRVQDGVQEGV